MASYTIFPATEADVPALVDLIYHGKICLPLNQLMWKQWPDETPQKARIESAVRGSLRDPKYKAYKIVHGETERIAGHLVLTRAIPQTSDEQNKESENDGIKPDLPPELRRDVTEMAMAAIDDVSKDSTNIERIEIAVLIIDQAVRGQGLGTMVMQKAFEWARADGIPLMVTSEPAARKFFTKLGFRSLKHADMDLSKYAPPHSGFGVFRMTRMTWSA